MTRQVEDGGGALSAIPGSSPHAGLGPSGCTDLFMVARLIVTHVTRIGDRVILAELGKPFVEGVGDDVVVTGSRRKHPEEESLQLEPGTHATEFEVAQPEFPLGEP